MNSDPGSMTSNSGSSQEEYFDVTKTDLFKLLPPNAKIIIELGCGIGTLGEQFKRLNPHCQYIGIERNSEKAKIAAKRLDWVIVGDIEELDIQSFGMTLGTVDCLICGELLPSLNNPWELLRRYSLMLSPEGQVLASIPNVQYWQRLVNLMRGEWENPDGKRQHWFALESIKSLFVQAGLHVYELQAKGRTTESFVQLQQLLQPTIKTLGISATQFATQTSAQYYIVRASKMATLPRRLLIQTLIMAPTGCDRVRVLEPDRFSATIPGVRTVSHVKSTDSIVPLPGEEKVFIWQRTIMQYPNHIPRLQELLRLGYLIVAEIDDNPIRRREYADNGYLSYRGCHCVQTSTEPLAKFLRQHNPNVAVFTNQLAFLPPPRSDSEDDSVTLFFGALNREKDWQPIIQALNQVIAHHQAQIRVKVIHDRRFFEALETERKEFEPFCSYERYQEIMNTCDIGLLPLVPNPVNEMKSDLKFLECASRGVAVLASPTVYEQSIKEGETGLIYRSVDEFTVKLNSLITDTQFRQKIATNAYEWVKNHRLLCQHYHQRRDWYLQMREQLPRLNEELRRRVPELFMN